VIIELFKQRNRRWVENGSNLDLMFLFGLVVEDGALFGVISVTASGTDIGLTPEAEDRLGQIFGVFIETISAPHAIQRITLSALRGLLSGRDFRDRRHSDFAAEDAAWHSWRDTPRIAEAPWPERLVPGGLRLPRPQRRQPRVKARLSPPSRAGGGPPQAAGSKRQYVPR
jgi:hypothetical protein